MRTLICLLICCVLCAAIPTAPAQAQDLSGFDIFIRSNNEQFPNPHGWGAAIDIDHSDWLFRLSLVRTKENLVRPSTVCITYAVRIGCRTESASWKNSLSGLRFGVMRELHLSRYARASGGIGISFNSIRADGIGVSGQAADIELPLGGEIGYIAMLHLRVSPVPRVPIALIGGLQQHWVHFDGCSDPPIYAPFCGVDAFHEAEVGIAFVFR
jgi:hypothetical protein